jgi:hypothetical protein
MEMNDIDTNGLGVPDIGHVFRGLDEGRHPDAGLADVSASTEFYAFSKMYHFFTCVCLFSTCTLDS